MWPGDYKPHCLPAAITSGLRDALDKAIDLSGPPLVPAAAAAAATASEAIP